MECSVQTPGFWRSVKTTTLIACGLGIAFGLGLVLAASVRNNDFGSQISTHKLAGLDVLVTSADQRATFRSGSPERGSVICAEPSPDVAKAVQESFGGGGRLSANVPAQVSGSAALSTAHARAEAGDQLGERLATIQLLRDLLYRMCEAYLNGAINELFYAALLSRYNDTMVTMLAGELAAGNFGRQLATIGGDANANAEANLDRALASVKDTAKQVEEADRELEAAEAELAAAKARGEDTTAEAAEVEDKKKAVQDQQNNLKLAARNATDADAVASASISEITPTMNSNVGSVMHQIQETYINDKDLGVLITACLTALTSPRYAALANVCSGGPGEPGLLKLAVDAEAGKAAAPPISRTSSRATDGPASMGGQ